MALKAIKLGEVMKPLRTEKFKLSEAAQFVGIISEEIVPADTYYVEGVGTFYAEDLQADPRIIEALGLVPVRRYCIPIVRYTTYRNPTTGKDGYDCPFSVVCLALSESDYRTQIVEPAELLGESDAKITQRDFKIVGIPTGNFLKYNIHLIPEKIAKWRTKPEYIAQVKEEYSQYKSMLEMSLASHITPEKFWTLWANKKGVQIPNARPAVSRPEQHETISLQADVLPDTLSQEVEVDDVPMTFVTPNTTASQIVDVDADIDSTTVEATVAPKAKVIAPKTATSRAVAPKTVAGTDNLGDISLGDAAFVEDMLAEIK